jgi:hypothetical protein
MLHILINRDKKANQNRDPGVQFNKKKRGSKIS